MKTELHCWIENRTRIPVPSTEAFERWLDPAKAAIACIDMHRGHVGPEAELTLAAPRARAKIPAQGAAILADGLVGGRWAALVETMRIRSATGTVLDHLVVISPTEARHRLGIG